MNINYDEQLSRIEEVEKKVRIAKAKLFEAEKELDETLDLVESELNEASAIDSATEVTIQSFRDNGWITVNVNGNLGGGEPMTFGSVEEARNSDFFRNRIEKGDVEGQNIRIVNNTDE